MDGEIDWLRVDGEVDGLVRGCVWCDETFLSETQRPVSLKPAKPDSRVHQSQTSLACATGPDLRKLPRLSQATDYAAAIVTGTGDSLGLPGRAFCLNQLARSRVG